MFKSMPSSEAPRLLFVHAHPDDETLTTGGTIAHYIANGADVHVVTCTLGEEGEVIGEQYAQLAVDAADQLGGYRISELTKALNALGINEPNFLGGPGHWRDSGMEGTAPRHHQRFKDADMREAVGELVAIIRRLRPHVVVTYDPDGGYGHPDHIQVHRVGRRAAELMELPAARVFCSTMNRDLMRERWAQAAAEAAAADRATTATPDPVRELDELDIDTFGLPAEDITHAIDVRTTLDRKRRSMLAHRSQIADDAFYLGSPDVFEVAFGTEWFASLGPPRPPGVPFGAALLEVGS
jgi:N-acetyl-1-D-myo-inositol-2-amino-2-deoxy-alpha-D-glucopyranoside deacetylase